MYDNVAITGYTFAENGMFVHFRDSHGRARHLHCGNIQEITVNGQTHILEV